MSFASFCSSEVGVSSVKVSLRGSVEPAGGVIGCVGVRFRIIAKVKGLKQI